jgi:hypothetical protein
VLARKGEAIVELGHAAGGVGFGGNELAEKAGGGQGGEEAEI